MADNTVREPSKAALFSDHESPSPKLPIVGIGASAGGLEAFKVFFGKMPANTGMAFVMIPHLDPGHKSMMVDIIGRYTAMPVVQVEERMKIEPDHIYIVPPNRNLAIEADELIPSEIPRHRGINLPVDFFFRSLAVARKERAIGIILSGTMRDGTMGLKDIKAYGGMVIAQAPETAQHDGMPQSAIDTGMVDFVLPIEDMPGAIVKYIAHPYIRGKSRVEDQDELNQVLAVIQARSRHDFRCYKRNTLVRRIERRMGLRQIERLADYVDVLKNDAKETDALLKDLLIGVTGFFREEQVWEKIGMDILPLMVSRLDAETPLRVWIPGCSTGEEAYTIAILVHNAFEKTNKHFNAQIFATDIDAEAIATGRAGVYPENIASNIPVAFMEKYFIKEDRKYRILGRIRESVVFAVQNLVGDAPFSNLHLISCRNLLIYLNPDIQTKLIEMFHFSLRDKGCLILGNSETIGYHQQMFETVSKECRIFRRIGHRDERMQIPILSYSGRFQGAAAAPRIDLSRKNMSSIMQVQLLKLLAPAAVLINKNFEILNLHGPTTQYLDLPQWDPVMDLLTMVKEGLRIKLRSAVHKALKNDDTITVADARVKRGRHFYPVRFTVHPVKDGDIPDPLFLIMFEDRLTPEAEPDSQEDLDSGKDALVQQLEAELMGTREDLQNTIEELETSNEELKASNEEMMSMNEELQSSNEELETSKEELQSMNEELNTVNAELREKVQELESTNNDMVNLMNSTEVATVFLDTSMRIRRFTPAAKHLFNLIPADVGRPIGDLAKRFNDDDLQRHVSQVLETLVPWNKEVETDEGRWYIRRILPFRTQDNRVDGLVLTFADVTDLKERDDLKKSEARLSAALAISGAGIYEHNVPIGPELYHSQRWAEMLGYPKAELPAYDQFMDWLMKRIHPDDVAALEKAYADFIEGRTGEYEVEIRMKKKSGEWIHVKGLSRAMARDAKGQVTRVIGVTLDVTTFRQAEAAIKENERQRFKAIFDMRLFGIAIMTPGQQWIEVNQVLCDMLGYSREELQQRTWVELSHPDDFGLEAENFKQVTAGDIHGYGMEKRFVQKNGHTLHTTLYLNAVRKKDGALRYLVMLVDDISDRKQAEEKIKFQATLLESVGQAVIATSVEGNVTYWNKVAEKLYGWTSQEVLGRNIMDLNVAPQDAKVAKDILAVVSNGKKWTGEFQALKKDGDLVPVLVSNTPILDENGKLKGIVGVSADLTGSKKMADQVRRLQKIEAIGTLAAGIAHDFNNIIGAIMGNISYALNFIEKDDEVREVLADVQESVCHAQTLTRQLVTFAKGGNPVKQMIELNKIVRDASMFVIRGTTSSCEFELDDGLWGVEADPGQLHQTFCNIVINATQAKPEGGLIQISTRNRVLTSQDGIPVQPGRYAQIRIKDQGVGIPEKHIQNIFDPFFTTKHKGSGLGLATADSIIRKHGGHISVDSVLGSGTTFHVYLPASGNTLVKSEGKKVVVHKGQGKILIMDDQKPILKMLSRMLNRMGYETVWATSGEQAIALYRDALHASAPFDLAILDLTIPGAMGGARTVAELLKVDPTVKAVVSSGYSNDPVMANYKDYGFCGVISKPYTRGHLAGLLNRIFSAGDT